MASESKDGAANLADLPEYDRLRRQQEERDGALAPEVPIPNEEELAPVDAGSAPPVTIQASETDGKIPNDTTSPTSAGLTAASPAASPADAHELPAGLAPSAEVAPTEPHEIEVNADVAALRAENERLRAQLSTVASRAERSHSPHKARRVVVNTLVVLTCLSLLLGTVAVWAQQTFLSNTERWVQIVGPIAQNPAVINGLSGYAADQVVVLLQVQQRAQSALPSQAQFLAGPLTSTVRNFTQTHVADAMRTGRFQQAWITVNAALHDQIVAALRGQSKTLKISNNTLTLDLIPIITQGLLIVREDLSGLLPPRVQLPDPNTASVQQGIQKLSQSLGVQLPPNYGQVVLLQSDQLTTAQHMVTLLDVFSILLPLLTLVFFIAALWLSPDRRRTLIQLGIGIVICFVLAKVAIAFLEQTVMSSVSNPTAHSVAQPVIDQALSYLLNSTTWILLIGALMALVAFLIGKPEWFKAGYAQLRVGYAWAQQEFRSIRLAMGQR